MQKKKSDKKVKPSKAPSKPIKAAPKKPVKKVAAPARPKAPLKAAKKTAAPVAKPAPAAKVASKEKPKLTAPEPKKTALKKVEKVVALAKGPKAAPPAVHSKAAAVTPVTKVGPAKKTAPEVSKDLPAKKIAEKPVVKEVTKDVAPKEIVEAKKVKKPSSSSSEITAAELEALTKAIMEDEDADEIVLTDAEGRKYCKIKECDQLATVDKYCRFHYLLNWKKIQLRKKILSDGKLEKYIEDLTSRYPDKYIEMIRRDLKTEKDFQSAIQELEIDDSGLENEFEEENEQLLEEVRGIGSGRAGAGSGREDEEF